MDTRYALLFAFPVVQLACNTVLVREEAPDAPGKEPVACTAEVTTLRGAESASFVGETLHVELDDGYAVLSLGSPGEPAARRSAPEEVARGDARWMSLGGDRYARYDEGRLTSVVASPGGELAVEAELDLGLEVAPGFEPLMGMAGSQLRLCLEVEGESTSLAMEFGEAAAPGALVADEWSRCDGNNWLRGARAGGYWVMSGTPSPEWGMDGVKFFDVATGTPSNDHAWNMTGVHRYGMTRDVVSDGRDVVATLDNPRYGFVYRWDGSVVHMYYTSFGTEPMKLVGVMGGFAIFAVPEDGGVALEARDLALADQGQEQAIPALPVRARLVDVAGAFDEVHALTQDANRLVLADGDGQVFLVSMSDPLEVLPLTMLEEGAEACD